MTNFVDTCPPPDPARANDPDYLKAEFCMLTPWRQLEVGIRMFDSWYTLYRKLLLSPRLSSNRFFSMAVMRSEVMFSS